MALSMVPEPAEGRLLSDARKRQRFEVLVRPELDALFRTVWRIVGRRAIAEEIVQETCLKAYTAFDPGDEPKAFRPWVFRVAVNLAFDHLKRGRHEATWGGDAAAAHLVADTTLGGHPHAMAEGREIGRALELALAALSPPLRAVVVLVLIEEQSYCEAATALGMTEDLVRSRLSRARADLRRHLAQHGEAIAVQAAASPASMDIRATTAKRGPQ